MGGQLHGVEPPRVRGPRREHRERGVLLIHERLGLNSYVPGWRETLFLKPREFPIEVSKPKEREVLPEEDILQVHASVMSELERLKWRIQRLENRDRITEEEIDRLRYIQEELQQILAA